MSEKLTDEQLHRIAEELAGVTFEPWSINVGDMATELLALRAERAKLEAALRFARDWLPEESGVAQWQRKIEQIDELLAHPAESGATRHVTPEGDRILRARIEKELAK